MLLYFYNYKHTYALHIDFTDSMFYYLDNNWYQNYKMYRLVLYLEQLLTFW